MLVGHLGTSVETHVSHPHQRASLGTRSHLCWLGMLQGD
jgi:hypothetical protein